MNASLDTIQPMAKVDLSISIEPIQPADNGSHIFDFSFICGIGLDGYTPFEQALYGKSPQSVLEVQIENDQISTYFGHLACDLMQWVSDSSKQRILNIAIVSVRAADPKEIVQAMAKMGGCSSSCDCGCGCG
jgi:hypothetical protein